LFFFSSILILKIKKQSLSSYLKLLFLTILLSVIIYLLLNLYFSFLEISNKNLIRSSFSGRDLIWLWSLEKISDFPILGYGSNGFSIIAHNDLGYPDTVKSHPHNFLIQFLFGWGLIGTSLILILLSSLAFKSLKKLFKKVDNILMFSGMPIIGLSVIGLFDGSFYHPTIVFYLILAISILAAELTKS